jgi:hypothetical protein
VGQEITLPELLAAVARGLRRLPPAEPWDDDDAPSVMSDEELIATLIQAGLTPG